MRIGFKKRVAVAAAMVGVLALGAKARGSEMLGRGEMGTADMARNLVGGQRYQLNL